MTSVAAAVKAQRVLVVDDEPLIRWSVAETLTERGYVVSEAGSAAEAIAQIVSGGVFDIVLLDLRLPDSTTLGPLEHLRGLVPDARIIVITAYGTPSIAARCTTLGAGFLGKPFHLSEIVSAIELY